MKDLPSPTDPLAVEDYADATVMPTTPFPQPRRPNAFRYGVFDSEGRIVRQSLMFRSYGKMGFAADPRPAVRSDDRPVVFAGWLPPHFGHFIIEGLSRLWYAKDRPELPIVWACPARDPEPGLTRWQRELLEVLGLQNEVVLVTEPSRFARVHVPQAGYRVKDFFSHQLAAFLGAYPARTRDPDSKLWLSRAGVAPEFGSVHAPRLDRELAVHGWTVVMPERLSIREQLELLATAGRVAGEEGSAFHLLALLSDARGLRVDILCRRPDRSVEKQNANYQTIADTIGLQQRLHVISDELVLDVRSGHVKKIATTLAGHLEAVDISRDVLTPGVASGPALAVAARIATTIAARSYLEVGSGLAVVSRLPNVLLSDVVRPAFATDPRRSQSERLHLFEMPPDEYFEYCARRDRRFDLVCIDAPGAPELVRRWFVASRRYAHRDTIWVLGADEQVLAPVIGPGSRTRAVVTPEGTCTLVLGPEGDPDSLESVVLVN